MATQSLESIRNHLLEDDSESTLTNEASFHSESQSLASLLDADNWSDILSQLVDNDANDHKPETVLPKKANYKGVRRRPASPASLTLTTGATFCPNWLMTTTSMISRKLCCRRRRITRESGDGRGGLTRRRSGTRREMVRGYGWGLMRLLKMRLWLMTELLSR
ncbi:hypothetical protein LINPERHAP1_LOCUS23622 [Linum perenne]